jgi:hypothetical protein
MEATLIHQVMDERRATRALASPHWAKAAGPRHAREWPTKIRPLALRGRGFLLPFQFFGCLAVKFRILTDHYKI